MNPQTIKIREDYIKAEEALLKKLKISKQLFINFPGRRKVPTLSRISLWVLKKQGAIIDTALTKTK